MRRDHQNEVTRWSPAPVLLAAITVLIMVVGLVVVAGGCGDSGDDGSDGGGQSDAIKRGGVLTIGTQPGNGQYDPALQAGTYGDIILQRQVLEKLVDYDQSLNLMPVLATEWSSEDGKVWKFTLQDGVTFTNGEPFTADDVVYSMDRLRDPDLGSPMVDVYANIDRVEADDPTTVSFYLKSVDSEFPYTLTDYRTLMLCKSVEDPMKEIVGTGPFMLESYSAEDRAVLTANPDYWGTDDDGNKLPFLDGIEIVYSPDISGQVMGLQGGSLDWVGGLSAEQIQTVDATDGLEAVTTPSNNVFTLVFRCDKGPGEELAFRQALMAGTDRQGIVDIAASGIAEPGNGTIVGPLFAQYYLEESPAYDPEKAKQLLADAGYADGVKITLAAQTLDPMPAMATVWKEQMGKIGVDVNIELMPPDVFYADDAGQENYYEAEFATVDWSTRVPPIAYLQLGFLSGASWNTSRFEDPELDEIVGQIPLELDDAKRAGLYKDAQRVLQDQVPSIAVLFSSANAGQVSTVSGIELFPDWGQTVFKTAYFTE